MIVRKEHEKCEFDVHEVYAIDILISSGDGKAKEKDTRTTVYKRTPNMYSLKMKTSRGTVRWYTNRFLRVCHDVVICYNPVTVLGVGL